MSGDHDPLSSTIGHYELGSVISSGSTSVVRIAVDTKTGDLVAIQSFPLTTPLVAANHHTSTAAAGPAPAEPPPLQPQPTQSYGEYYPHNGTTTSASNAPPQQQQQKRLQVQWLQRKEGRMFLVRLCRLRHAHLASVQRVLAAPSSPQLHLVSEFCRGGPLMNAIRARRHRANAVLHSSEWAVANKFNNGTDAAAGAGGGGSVGVVDPNQRVSSVFSDTQQLLRQHWFEGDYLSENEARFYFQQLISALRAVHEQTFDDVTGGGGGGQTTTTDTGATANTANATAAAGSTVGSSSAPGTNSADHHHHHHHHHPVLTAVSFHGDLRVEDLLLDAPFEPILVPPPARHHNASPSAGSSSPTAPAAAWTLHNPEDINRSSYSRRPKLKLANVGMTAFKVHTVGWEPRALHGHHHCVAPELLPYDAASNPNAVALPPITDDVLRKADIWSCGVILYVLLSGMYPFDDEDPHILTAKIIEGEFSFPEHFSRGVRGVRHLIASMLVPDPLHRASMAEVAMHPWFNIWVDRSLSLTFANNFTAGAAAAGGATAGVLGGSLAMMMGKGTDGLDGSMSNGGGRAASVKGRAMSVASSSVKRKQK